MNPLLILGLAGSFIATVAVLDLARPALGGRMVWPALGAGLGSGAVTVTLGVAFDIASAAFLIGLTLFAVPVFVLLEAAAVNAGADRIARWVLMLTWGLLVFPAAALGPLAAADACQGIACRIEDFGGALPLFVSSSVFLLLTWLPAGSRPALPDSSPAWRAPVAFLAVWLGWAIWLVSLEGAFDGYTPRLALAAITGPVAAVAGWLAVDLLRDARMPITRNVGAGVIAGIVATTPGAAMVAFPWSAIVGFLAGVAASLAYFSRGLGSASLATRWGFTVLVAAAVGLLAPPVAGDAVGILFTARISGLTLPGLAFVGVAVFAFVVSAPAWVLLRRRSLEQEPPPRRTPGG